MGFLTVGLCALAGVVAGVPVTGTVVDASGRPLPGAQVWLEPGIAGALTHQTANAQGGFRYENVPAGLTGIFAYAPGHAFGGVSRTIKLGEPVADLLIRLAPPSTVSGRVLDYRGVSVSGARVIGALIHGNPDVGIPFFKLTSFGFPEPVTDSEGRFTVTLLPAGAAVSLKVTHSAYPQATLLNVASGAKDARITMNPGVLVEGTVSSRDGRAVVANAGIIIRTTREPYDTVLTKTDALGQFSVKLAPGHYLCQAASAELRSPGWERLTVSGNQPVQRVALRVAGTARVHGEVRDAVSGDPVAGAKVTLTAYGNPAASATTGLTGQYELPAAEGDNVVTVQAAPGFRKPPTSAVSANVREGDDVEMPTFWLTPFPAHAVMIVDESGAPVAGALVRLVRPSQNFWYVGDERGRVELRAVSAPESGDIIGLAEHPSKPFGAVFRLNPDVAGDARVQLLPLGSVSGQVVNKKGAGIEGAIVGALFQSDTADDPLPLWRTASRRDGRFDWPAVVPYVPSVCLASTGADYVGRSVPYNLEPGAHQHLGNIVIDAPQRGSAAPRGKSLAGTRLEWYGNPLLAGPAVDERSRNGKRALVIYCAAAETEAIVQSLETVCDSLSFGDLLIVVIADGPYSGVAQKVSVLQGRAPGPATTFLIDSAGLVTLETVGLPPVCLLQGLGTLARGPQP